MPKLAVRLALMGLVFRYFNRPFTLQTMKLLGRNPNANVLILAQLDAVEAQKVDLPNYVFDPKNVQQIQDYKKRLKEIGIDEVEIEFPSEGVFYETSFPIGPSLKKVTLRNENFPTDEAAIARLSRADASDIKAIGVSQLEMSAGYYKNPLKQSEQSFLLMRIAAVVCLILFVAAIIILFLQKPANIAYVSILGGAISAFFSGIFFLMFRHASNQALAYKPQIDRTQNFIMANSVCETMDEERRQRSREELIRWFVGLPSNTSEIIQKV